MQRSPLVPVFGFGLIGLALLVAVLVTTSFLGPATGAQGDPSAPSGGEASGSPAGSPATSPSPDPGGSPSGGLPTPAAPTPGVAPTPARTSPADPQLAFADFVLRLGSARQEADQLMTELQAAAQGGDDAGVRSAALDILALVERERAWLVDHPPAACYAEAHRDADAMYVAFGVAADLGIAWTDAEGLARIGALLEALDAVAGAVEQAQDLTASLGRADCG